MRACCFFSLTPASVVIVTENRSAAFHLCGILCGLAILAFSLRCFSRDHLPCPRPRLLLPFPIVFCGSVIRRAFITRRRTPKQPHASESRCEGHLDPRTSVDLRCLLSSAESLLPLSSSPASALSPRRLFFFASFSTKLWYQSFCELQGSKAL